MSRIIVKNLPQYLSDDKLKEKFTKRLVDKYSSTNVGNLITDLKILKDRDGQSRRFAFIGYRNEDDAKDAVQFFHRTFIDATRIDVSMAKSFADPSVPQPVKLRKREALKRLREREEELQNANKKPKKDKKNNKSEIDAEIEKNKKLQEFIETMKPNSQVTSWEKLAKGPESQSESQQEDVPQGNSLLAEALAMKGGEDSDDEYVDFDQLQGEHKDEHPEEEEKMVSLDNFGGSTEEPQEQPEEQLEEQSQEEPQDQLARDEQVSDLDWFKQRRIRIREGENEPVRKSGEGEEVQPKEESQVEEPVEEEPVEEEPPAKSEEEVAIEKISETGRLFLRNILYGSTEDDFKELFGKFGELEEVHIALDTRTGQSKGFAYVQFKDPKDAVEAYIELDKQIFQGRLLHILPANSQKNHRLDEFDMKNLPLKKQRELKRKATASKQTFAWNSLYMNQDAVLGSVAAKLGMQKSQLIDPENSSSAVKQALAEAHVIGDVRKYFESKGVDLAKFDQLKSPGQRDDRVILVKNFPYGTTVEELGELFLPFGKLERFLMPPAGTIAIIQYRDVTSARAAFSKLAYKRFKDGIIYLEKGPKDCFTRDAQTDERMEGSEKPEVVKEAKPSAEDIMNTDDTQAEADDGFEGPTASIFVKNLNFATTTQQLAEKFKPFDGFVVAQVKTKPDPSNTGKVLSMGFGFVEFKSRAQAVAVINALDGTALDGHKLQLKLSHRQGGSTNAPKQTRKKSGKIIVKNLPFEAARKDVFELFSSFGQLKSVRVPKKFDKSARGFAFVEFLLPKEAENAMDQLQGVHLLGRRLVMQYAQEDAEDAEEEIRRMTNRVKKQQASREYGAIRNSGGRRKVDIDEEDEGMDGV
ncbi:hypothetical protein ZYGR_0I05260 [Zygosaccharomyces rouxii]|uniref:Multiple RNA-binding domain-containing protein 1 n=2 Tax=Zygosaccharomyces rouxii TaxID=4956 RepID=C5DTZ1_ZYGRC|nr:uncharacterized protein ZYRO0C12452g [Zygosaccharomyces rouxii]KAH9201572.1 hypothetical protein LQ764DRAFT_233327 [Zygosaccharomyces rouxii]GAV48229.1 hypothetical protein ZYGR_0I05260 [Zygosaccharomyces rouxii]CAR27252.1 ZYRO0C12452p [Zygosaccharomyces rouxii]